MKRFLNPLLLSFTFLLAFNTGALANNKIANGINMFGFELNKLLINGDENLVYSPLSISSALSTTYAGAKGPTAEAMKTHLHYGKNTEAFHQAYGKVMSTLQTQSRKGPLLKIANSMWLQEGYQIEEAFKNILATAYQITPAQLNFKKDPSGAVVAINKEVSLQTHHEIPELLAKLDESTRFVITNAVFFEGQWASQFDQQLIKDKFTLASGGVVQADYMHQTRRFGMKQDETKKYVLMPYRNSTLAALVIVPQGEKTIYDLDQAIDAEMVQSMIESSEVKNLSLSLPKFSVETSVPSMRNVLTKLGVGIIFDPARVDLSGINGVTSGDEKLVISDVVHKAVVEVTPFGTKAAAATAVIGVRTTSMLPDEEPIPFAIDQPFYFLIVDTTTKTTLFTVRVMNPKA